MARFATLDAMRGIAAIGVMLAHSYGSQTLRVPSGYLAVDLFFGLSGFVMALSYQKRLRAGMRLHQFLALRAARLWPMLLAGSAVGLVLAHGSPWMVFLVPDWTAHGLLFPANGVFWSLLMEVCAYVVFATVLVRLRLVALLCLVMASGIGLAACAAWWPALLIEYGNAWSTMIPGICRTAYAFTLGVVVYRVRMSQGLPQVTSSRAWVLPLAFVYIMLFLNAGRALGLLTMMAGPPLILWWATKWQVPQTGIAERLSDLSYPLYCVHLPIVGAAINHGWPVAALWLPLIALSVALDRWWDRPMRRVLREMAAGSWKFHLMRSKAEALFVRKREPGKL